jgi:hypothetical protein
MKKNRSNSLSEKLNNKYKVIVTTGDELGSGTDSNVFIKVYFDDYSTDRIHLKKSLTNKNAFERGQTDVFEIKMDYYSKLKKIKYN